jgi:hypothetical protein
MDLLCLIRKAMGLPVEVIFKLYDDGLVFAYITDELEEIVDIPFNAMNALAAPTDF